MTRATETAIFFSIISLVYLLFFLEIVTLPEIIQHEILPVLPWWVLVSFGSYSLGNIGYHLFKFNDCENAYYELMAEIQLAKDELRPKGVSVD